MTHQPRLVAHLNPFDFTMHYTRDREAAYAAVDRKVP